MCLWVHTMKNQRGVTASWGCRCVDGSTLCVYWIIAIQPPSARFFVHLIFDPNLCPQTCLKKLSDFIDSRWVRWRKIIFNFFSSARSVRLKFNIASRLLRHIEFCNYFWSRLTSKGGLCGESKRNKPRDVLAFNFNTIFILFICCVHISLSINIELNTCI